MNLLSNTAFLIIETKNWTQSQEAQIELLARSIADLQGGVIELMLLYEQDLESR